ITFQTYIADDDQPIDWASQKDALRLPTIPSPAWDGVFANFTANTGSTVASYHAILAADATYLSQFAPADGDVLQLVSYEIEKANAAFTAQTLATVTDDSLPAPGLPLVFQRSFQQSIAGRYYQGLFGSGWASNWDISARTDASGDGI